MTMTSIVFLEQDRTAPKMFLWDWFAGVLNFLGNNLTFLCLRTFNRLRTLRES